MDLPKVIAEDLLKLKNLKKLAFFTLCILVSYFAVSVYNNFAANKKMEQIQIQGLINLAEIHSARIKLLNSKIDLLNSEIKILKENKRDFN